MLKLGKYFKPFISLTVLCVIFLFIVAMCDLKLPDYMSDIVNVGIQSSGIEDVTPKAISEKSLDNITKLMNEEDRNFVMNNYTIIMQDDNEYIYNYPLLDKENIYILSQVDEESLKKLNNIFETYSQVMTNVVAEYLKDNNINTQSDNSIQNAQIDLSQMHLIIPQIIGNMNKEELNDAIYKAKMQNEVGLSQVAVSFTSSYYSELGVDVGNKQMSYIVDIGVKMLIISFIGIIADIIVRFLSSKIGAGFGKKLRKAVFEKVESFSNAEFEKFSVASLITRTTNDITQVQNVTVMAVRMLVFAPIMGIGALVMMMDKTTQMTWTIVLACSLIIVLIILLFKFVFPKFKIIQKLTDKLNLVSKENLSGVMVIKAFGTQKYEEKRFDEVNREVTDVNLYVIRFMSFMMPCMMLIMNLLCVLILWVGAKEIANSQMQVGDMMAVIQYAMQVVTSFLVISMMFIMLPRAAVSAQRINEVLDTDITIKNPENPKQFEDNKRGIVEFRNVTFKYEGADETVLDNISFVAKPGQTTAFIGSTGSGKSTLINLVPRFFDVTKGEVLVNGVNVKELDIHMLRNQIGYIPQKGNLLEGTIMSNLKYGNDNVTKEYVEECARIAQAEEFINSKEKGYDSEVAQGGKNVSGGQKQRLSIARALVKKAPIYIFDDSFSALDFKTDAKLRKELKEFAKESTILIVAQRVNTILNAEQIIVLDKGRIVGMGTHEELLKSCSQYYEIASSQLTKEELENE